MNQSCMIEAANDDDDQRQIKAKQQMQADMFHRWSYVVVIEAAAAVLAG